MIFPLLLLLTFVFFPALAYAHVGYVIEDKEFITNSGRDFAFLFKPLAESRYVALMVLVTAAAVVLYLVAVRTGVFKRLKTRIERQAAVYTQYFAWMLRLSLGIALIGAGSSSVLISPAIEGMHVLSFIQILLGFLLLLGFALPLVVCATIVLFLWALFSNVYLFGNVEFLAGAVALLVLADSRPGFDDLFGIPFYSPLSRYKPYVPLILRIGIGSAMIFLAVYEKLLNPHASAAVIEKYALTSVVPVPPALWVLGAGVVELTIGAALLAGFKTRLASAIAFAVLSLSFFYFGEDVYSHITLFGVLSVLFVTGSGKWGVDKLCTNKSQPTNAKRGV